MWKCWKASCASISYRWPNFLRMKAHYIKLKKMVNFVASVAFSSKHDQFHLLYYCFFFFRTNFKSVRLRSVVLFGSSSIVFPVWIEKYVAEKLRSWLLLVEKTVADLDVTNPETPSHINDLKIRLEQVVSNYLHTLLIVLFQRFWL